MGETKHEDIPPPRSSRSSGSSSNRICRCGARWKSSAFRRATFYRWYDRYQTGGPEALEDKPSQPIGSGTASPTRSGSTSSSLALDAARAVSPRELAVRFTDTQKLLRIGSHRSIACSKAHDLITSPAFIVIKAADEFKDKTTAPNQLWQTDFTYLKVIGWGWFYLSTILDDFSRYIIAWKLCTTMKADDVTDTLELALAASGCDKRPRRAQAAPA